MSDAAAPSGEELAAAAAGLKQVEVKEGGAGFDEAQYKAAWDAAGGDAAKVAETLSLKKAPADYAEFISMCKLGKFKD